MTLMLANEAAMQSKLYYPTPDDTFVSDTSACVYRPRLKMPLGVCWRIVERGEEIGPHVYRKTQKTFAIS